MRKLNPKIEKFWNDAGYLIKDNRGSRVLENTMYMVIWIGSKNNNIINTIPIAITRTIGYNGSSEENVEIEYMFNKKLVSEEAMLRIIKMKAFL